MGARRNEPAEMATIIAANIWHLLIKSLPSAASRLAWIDRMQANNGAVTQASIKRLACLASAAVWLTVLFGCVYWLFDHSYRPAQTGEVVAVWPRESELRKSASGLQLVMFAHPCCPCTLASLYELDELLQRLPNANTAIVTFTTRGLNQQDLAIGNNVDIARGFKKVSVHLDGGAEAKAFGATISGELIAFDALGQRVFRGGLTSARGHRGESSAKKILQRLVCGEIFAAYETPVFGCRLP